jgi:3-phenylpropionate/trans-cinnamate dioxygenase ferredoxin reductase subunit
MTGTQTFVIVGAGLAAGKAAQELRESGFDGHLVLYGAEAHLPYERPPLSKAYLMGDDGFDSALVQPRSGTTRTTSTCNWAPGSPPSTPSPER